MFKALPSASVMPMTENPQAHNAEQILGARNQYQKVKKDSKKSIC